MAAVDHCTLFPDGNYGEACCLPHDDAFAAGGTILDFIVSNVDLGACVALMSEFWPLGLLMAAGTTLFGLPFWIRAARERRRSASPSPITRPASSGLFHARSTAMTDFRNFRGAARPLDDIDLPRLGHRIGVGEDEIHAVMDVEAAGGAWDARKRPKMLFEPHRFYKNLGPGPKRDRAVREGLAYPSWGEKPYPKDSYPRLLEAMAIDETAALKSASWGLGQILGENHAMVGYDTVQEMVLDTLDDADKHLEMMVAFILAAKLDDELRAHDWTGFARGYNGPQHAKHDYAGRLTRAYSNWARIRDTPWSPGAEIAHVPIPATAPRADVPATIEHNGGPVLNADPASVPNLSPVEQSGKAIGAGSWTAVVGTMWTVLVSLDVLPTAVNTPEVASAVLTIVGAVSAAVGAYRARDKRFAAPAS